MKILFLICITASLVFQLTTGCASLGPAKKEPPVSAPQKVLEVGTQESPGPLKINAWDLHALRDAIKKRMEQVTSPVITDSTLKNADTRDRTKSHYQGLLKQIENVILLSKKINHAESVSKQNRLLIEGFNDILPALFTLLLQSLPDQESSWASAGDPCHGFSTADTSNLVKKMENAFQEKNYQDILDLYAPLKEISYKARIPPMAEFFYSVALYELGNKTQASEIMKRLAGLSPENGYVALQMKLGKWFTSIKNLDMALKAYSNIVNYAMELEESRAHSQEEIALIAEVRAPLEEELLALVNEAERDFYEYQEFEAARRSCMDALHIMTTHGLFEGPYFKRCEQILDAIREEEKKAVQNLVATALQTARENKQFAEARKLLSDYLDLYPETDFRDELAEGLEQITALENIYQNQNCLQKIADIQDTYQKRCLKKIEETDYEKALGCLDEIIAREDPQCFADVPEIAAIKNIATREKEEIQAYYIQQQLEKAAGLFARARKSKTANQKKDYFLRSYYILNKLQTTCPENPLSSKIARYIESVEKEIRTDFPELLEKKEKSEKKEAPVD